MSFNNTKTPRKPKDSVGQKYTVPQRPSSYGNKEYYLTPELEVEFRKLYPVTMNPVLMRMFHISHSCLHRFARELGLTKDRDIILKAHAKQVKKICEKNGYYDSLRGKPLSEACRKGSVVKRKEQGFHPLLQIKTEHPRRYKFLMKRRSENRKAIIAKEKRRVQIGLDQHTRIHLPCYDYSRPQVNFRYNAKKRGYVLGNVREFSGERYTIYYTEETERAGIFEKNGSKLGFIFREKKIPKHYECRIGKNSRLD